MRRLHVALRVAAAIGAGSMLFQSGCAGAALRQLNQLNPCGLVLFCDPVAFEFARSNTTPGINDDPFCTFPPYCGANDPLFGQQEFITPP